MKTIQKTIMVAALVTLALFVGGATMSFATVCTNVEVSTVGAKSGENAVFVKRTADSSTCAGFGANVGDGMWIVLDPANTDAMLATALTAMSLGNPITIVNASGDFVNQGTVIELYVAK